MNVSEHDKTTRSSRSFSAAIVCVLALLLTVGAAAQEEPAVTAEAVVPVIGSVPGYGGAEWRSDVAIRNDSKSEVTVVLSMIAAPDEPFLMLNLQPGESSIFRDIARQAFGKTGILSPLVVQTLGSRSVTVAATAYSVREDAVSEPQVLTVVYGNRIPYITSLAPLSVNDTFRTNLGFVNDGDATAVFVVALQRVPGRDIARGIVNVAPHSLLLLTPSSVFPLFSEANDFAVVVEHTSPSSFSFASVVSNDTDRAVFVAPR